MVRISKVDSGGTIAQAFRGIIFFVIEQIKSNDIDVAIIQGLCLQYSKDSISSRIKKSK